MSIAPEIPYSNLEDDDSSDDDNNWKDPSLGNPSYHGNASAGSRLIDIDAPYDAASNNNTPRPTQSYADTTVSSGSNHHNADDHWVLPTHIHPRDVLGDRKSRTATIQQQTGSFIEYNATYNQVDIWGDAQAIAKTKSMLDNIVQGIFEKDAGSQRKSKKWGKPERELTEREKRRAERRQAKLEEEKRYQGQPQLPQNYHAVFPLPDTSLPLLRFTGENDSYFNQIRADCKTYLWYESATNSVRLEGNNEDALKNAAVRVRNWYLRSVRKPMGGVLRLFEQPTAQTLLEFQTLPKGFVLYKYHDPEEEKQQFQVQRLLKSVATGVMNRVDQDDLIAFNETAHVEELSERARTLNSRNESLIEEQLAAALESLRLNDWVIRMKIRFGQISLLNYKDKKEFLSIEYVSDQMFRKARFRSELAPCISKSLQGLSGLFEFLSTDPDAVEFSDNPRTSFVINAQQYPNAAPPRIPGMRDASRGEMWDTTMQISFTDSGQRRLWSTVTDCVDMVDISALDIESHYSWDLKLQYARRLPNDDVNSPHEKFSHGLRVSSDNRLIMVTSNDYQPQLVTQKTKWLYSYKGYIIEVCHDEVWNMNRVERTDYALPVDLTLVKPHRALYKVSLYKEAWVNRFAENLDLKIGQAPSWSLRDFLASPDENTRSIMQMAKNISQILNSTVPLYYDQASSSLV
ncbi:hypothetical protein V8B55DRAFT_1487132 [Mucor lusitanicus]|uniref:DUF7905 domain-containing protein n=2 Tax=Mucor circinelloides f. lusitanicus TaxID=29924 RepID=A0A168LZ75_MUCCL|nr:hypothetical protein FB192DRAFT_1365220 [Mucor lusitanicus]OAD04156.1 hypothetical protein MUCCIDRAFT_79284 [Mucor lusitanicus CBS 277.49]